MLMIPTAYVPGNAAKMPVSGEVFGGSCIHTKHNMVPNDSWTTGLVAARMQLSQPLLSPVASLLLRRPAALDRQCMNVLELIFQGFVDLQNTAR